MKDLLFSICTVSLFSSVITYLTPNGEAKKQMKFICSLIICAVILSPLIGIIKSQSNIDVSLPSQSDSTTNNVQEKIIAEAINNICDGYEQKIASLYGIKDAELIINVDTSDYTSIVIKNGTLSGEGNVNEAATYLSRELMCEIEIVDKD